MEEERQPQHDEINLVRLLRRIEKSVASPEDWKPSATRPGPEIWLRARKELQVREAAELECKMGR
jgi:beta-phosphoglucomutase-like phosphatase (HAD superfamily)